MAHASVVVAESTRIEGDADVRRARGSVIRKLASGPYFIILPAIWAVAFLVNLLAASFDSKAAYDLRVAFLPAAHAVIHGNSPLPSPSDASVGHQAAYVYPPFVAFLTTPLAVLPVSIAVAIGVVASFAAVPALLYVAGVRDIRCYGVAIAWGPTLNAIQNVNISLPIAFGLALAWRFRSSQRLSGVLLGCMVAAKLFVWPLLAWPLARARRTTVGVAVAAGAVLALGSWAAVGFDGLTTYPKLLRMLTSYEETQSYSVSGALRVIGLGVTPSRGVALLLTLALLAACITFGRRGDEPRAFAAAILAALASTPILWQHYLMLLLVALAVCRPYLSFAWFVPLTLWIAPTVGNGAVWQTLLVPIAAAVVGASCLVRPRDVIPNASASPRGTLDTGTRQSKDHPSARTGPRGADGRAVIDHSF
jgi:hypothetical protein